MEQIFFDVGIIIIISTFLAIIFYKMNQSPIFGYIIAGILAGPIFKMIKDPGIISLLSQIGVTFLLFVVGLELDMNQVKKNGAKSFLISITQMVFVFLISYFISRIYFNKMMSLFIGILVSFSSTTIVAKFLNESNAINSTHGKIAIMCLIVQDIMSIIVLSIMKSINGNIIASFEKAIAFIVLTYLISKIMVKVLNSISKSRELLLLSTVSMVFLFGGMADYFGLNSALGAYLAGFFLSSSVLSYEISSEIKSLRDFFIVIFFFSVGLMFEMPTRQMMTITAMMILLGMVLKMIIVFVEMKLFGYGNRTSFMTSIMMAQLSIFAIIIAQSGYNYGIFSKDFVVDVSLAVVVSMLISTYLMKYSEKLYEMMSGILRPLDKFSSEIVENAPKRIKNHIVIFGAHQIGMKIITSLKNTKKKFIVVDIDSDKIKKLIREKYYAVYGDMNSKEILDRVNLKKAKIVISTVSRFEYNALLLQRIKKINPRATTIFFARNKDDAIKLYELGVDFVMVPEIFGGKKVYDYLVYLSPRGIRKWGKRRYKELAKEDL